MQIAIDQDSYLKWEQTVCRWDCYIKCHVVVLMKHVTCSTSHGVTAMGRNAAWCWACGKDRQGVLPTEAELLCILCKFEIKVLNKRHVYKDWHSLCQTVSLLQRGGFQWITASRICRCCDQAEPSLSLWAGKSRVSIGSPGQALIWNWELKWLALTMFYHLWL